MAQVQREEASNPTNSKDCLIYIFSLKASKGKEMPDPKTRFTKLRYINVTVGIILYIVDIGTDIWVALQFYNNGHYAWFALTNLFVLTGSLGPQIFSYAWFRDDIGGESFKGRTRTQYIFLHILQLGVFTRYYQLMKKGFSVVQSEFPLDHKDMFDRTADLSMLRLFETFLESAPQLLLQIYIILGHNHRSIVQYLCIVGSFFSIAWATVEYRRCLRRSLADVQEMRSGLPTAVYLFYKLFTITSRILSLSLLVVLDLHCTSAFVFLWLCGTIWAHVVKTDFCTSPCLEWFYRGIVGVILIFTFFNIEGQKVGPVMTIYYGLYTSQNLAFILLFYFLKSFSATSSYLLPVTLAIAGSKIAGLICLTWFYAILNRRSHERVHQIPDVVDGLAVKWTGPDPDSNQLHGGSVQSLSRNYRQPAGTGTRVTRSEMTNSEKRMKAFLQH